MRIMHVILFIGLTPFTTVFWATNEHDKDQAVSPVSIQQIQKKEESVSTQRLVRQTADLLLWYQTSSECCCPRLVCYLCKHMPRVRGTYQFLPDMIQAWAPEIAKGVEKYGNRRFFERFVKEPNPADALAAAKYLNAFYCDIVSCR